MPPRHALSLVGLTLLLGACASRPPEPTADMSPANAAAASSQPGGADRGTASTGGPSGSSVASSSSSVPPEHSVFFEFDSSALSSRAQAVVQQNARNVQPKSTRVRLEGNADDRGSREYNLALGQRRAEAVRQAMVLNGVRAEGVEAISYGEERPRCTDEVEECRATNRRVDILATP